MVVLPRALLGAQPDHARRAGEMDAAHLHHRAGPAVAVGRDRQPVRADQHLDRGAVAEAGIGDGAEAGADLLALDGAGNPVDGAEEGGGEGVDRCRVERVRGAGLDRLAVAHQDDSVGREQRLLGVVGDHEDRDGGILEDADGLLAKPAPERRIEAGERLVEEDHARPGGQRADQRDPLLLAAGQSVRVARRQMAHADPLEQRFHPANIGRPLLAGHPVGDVLGHRQMRKEGEILEQIADAAARRRDRVAGIRKHPPGDADAAALGALQPGDGAQRRRLAAARRAEQAHELALGDLEREIAHRLFAAEADAQLLKFQHRAPPPPETHEPVPGARPQCVIDNQYHLRGRCGRGVSRVILEGWRAGRGFVSACPD